MGAWDVRIRRGLHIASPVLLVYYLLPDDLWVGFAKVHAALLLWGATLVIEVVRLAGGVDLVGIREYERGQVSAYFWGGTGLLLGLLFFPAPLVVVAMVGMAWVDPLCAAARRGGGYPYVPFVAYAAIAFLGLRLLTGHPPGTLVLLALLGAATMVAAEYPNLAHVDDDFTTLVGPLVAMWAAGLALL